MHISALNDVLGAEQVTRKDIREGDVSRDSVGSEHEFKKKRGKIRKMKSQFPMPPSPGDVILSFKCS